MSQRDERPKFALIRKTGYDIGANGKVKAVNTEIMGDPEAMEVAVRRLKDVYGEDNVIEDKDKSSSSRWSGVGKGRMDASRATRTKRIYNKGGGWTDVSLN